MERADVVNQFEKFDLEFEKEVQDYLKGNGFEADIQVGCSNFKIDLGLKLPKTSNYVLAIECDGLSYHFSGNARDRDRLRQQILERMGWKYYRIWSTAWVKNNLLEKNRLLEVVTSSIQSYGREQKIDSEKKSTEDWELMESFEKTVVGENVIFPEYEEIDVKNIADLFYDFQDIVFEVLKKEAPLSEEWLLKRIVWWFGREKVTSVVQDKYATEMYGCHRKGIIRRNGFLYLENQNDFVMRVPGDGEKRDIKYISREELSAGILMVVKQNITVDKDNLYRFIAKQLGFTRVGEKIYKRFDEALDMIEFLLDIQGDTIVLKE